MAGPREDQRLADFGQFAGLAADPLECDRARARSRDAALRGNGGLLSLCACLCEMCVALLWVSPMIVLLIVYSNLRLLKGSNIQRLCTIS